MTNLPVSNPFVMKVGPPPYYNRHNMHRRHYPRKYHNPMDMRTLEMISALVPQIRQFGIQGNNTMDDLVHVLSNDVVPDKDQDFNIDVDLGLFAPKEISVKIIDDHLVIEAKHEERMADDIGFVSRHLIRRCELPQGYNADCMVSKLHLNGMLNVSLPKPKHKPKERIIALQLEGPNGVLKQIKSGKGDQENGIEEEKTEQSSVK